MMSRARFLTLLSFIAILLSAVVAPQAFAATRQGFSIRQDGVILKNGEPLYPFGFYHVSDYKNRYDVNMANDVEKMGQAGFNVVQLVVTGPDAEKSSEKARQKAQQYGMYIIASYYRPSYQTWMSRLKDDGTLMGWNVLDDFNVPYKDPKRNPTEAKAESQLMWNYGNTLSAPTLVYGSGGGYPFQAGNTKNKYLFGEYKDAMDIVGVQTYPIDNTDGAFAGAPLEENIAYLKYAKQQLPENKPLFANLQAFAWGGKRYPNVVETRNMTWASVVTRMEGILAYSYWEESGDLSTKTDIWEEWKKLRADINGDLVKALLDGKYTYIDTTPNVTGKPRIHAATFEHRNKVYVIVMNTNSQTAVTTTNQITLPSNVVQDSMKPLFPGDTRYGTTLQYGTNNGTPVLNGSVAASGVQAYVFSTVAAGGNTSNTASPTPTPTPTGSSQACRSDFNGDKAINMDDFTIFANNIFKQTPANTKTDINKDGKVNIRDYRIFLTDFLKTCS